MTLTLIYHGWHCCPHADTLLHHDYLVRTIEFKIIHHKNLYFVIFLYKLFIDHYYLFAGNLLNIGKL